METKEEVKEEGALREEKMVVVVNEDLVEKEMAVEMEMVMAVE
tara:strand:+ start:3558 stop:3686 length:129 start_codon:yes stop_codon:yes gene_type:complete